MLAKLEQKLGYKFNKVDRLQLALTHRSYASTNNERMEFLGDALLSVLIAEVLFHKPEHYSEGGLSQARAMLVNKQQLAQIAQSIELEQYLMLGDCEKHNDKLKREAIVADAIEAIIAAIYLDGGWSAIKEVILPLFDDLIEDLAKTGITQHPKTELQEWTQAHSYQLPIYKVIKQLGPSHNCTFVVECCLRDSQQTAQGQGSSKQIAEEMAAKKLLELLRRD